MRIIKYKIPRKLTNLYVIVLRSIISNKNDWSINYSICPTNKLSSIYIILFFTLLD